MHKTILRDSAELIVINIRSVSDLKNDIDKYFVSICEGNSGNDLLIVKTSVKNLFTGKNETWKAGAIAEFFIHLHMIKNGFKMECLFQNLEERSIKKGFDGLYSLQREMWLMESKAGFASSKKVSHKNKVKEAYSDIKDKIQTKQANNPWQNAYNHACHKDVGASENIIEILKFHKNNYIMNRFPSVNDFNLIPCGTVFVEGKEWPSDLKIREEISEIISNMDCNKLKVVCVTAQTISMFEKYLEEE